MTAAIKKRASDTPLLALICDKIAKDGSISVADYMELCLAHPEYGYYMTRDPFGARGDFTTAPEVSQMFGEIIGAYVAHQWQNAGSPSPFHLVECGPGRGTLMADMLRVFMLVPGMSEALHIHFIETSPVLKKIQSEKLGDTKNFFWHDDIDSVPEGAFAVVANEFLDALPIRQFQKTKTGWSERHVGVDARGGLKFVLRPSTLDKEAMEGDVIETSSQREDFITRLSQRLKRSTGFALFIDYGSDAAEFGDTLQAVQRHVQADPLTFPGACDLTSHVDFAGLRAIALREGCAAYGPVAQGEFLIQLGLGQRAKRLSENNDVNEINAAVNRLSAPDQMGALFKVMAFSSPGLPAPPAFPV